MLQAVQLPEELSDRSDGRPARPSGRGLRLSGMRSSGAFERTRRKGEGGAAGTAATVGRLKRWMNKAQADTHAGDDTPDAHAHTHPPPPAAHPPPSATGGHHPPSAALPSLGGCGRERHDSTNFFVHEGQRTGRGMVLGKPHSHQHPQEPSLCRPKKPSLPYLDAINARQHPGAAPHVDHSRASRRASDGHLTSGLRGSGKACTTCRQDALAGPFNSVTDGAGGSPAFHIDVPPSLDRKATHRAAERHSGTASHGRGSSATQRGSWAGTRVEMAGAGAGAGAPTAGTSADRGALGNSADTSDRRTLSNSNSTSVVEEQAAATEHDVRMLMPAAVVGSLRRSAMILSGLSVAFAFYDWVEWQVCLPGLC